MDSGILFGTSYRTRFYVLLQSELRHVGWQGSPAELLKDPNGMLTALVNETGDAMSARIRTSIELRENENHIKSV